MKALLLVLFSAGLAGAQPPIGVASISQESDPSSWQGWVADFGWPGIPSGEIY
jgi:hypothetical protein